MGRNSSVVCTPPKNFMKRRAKVHKATAENLEANGSLIQAHATFVNRSVPDILRNIKKIRIKSRKKTKPNRRGTISK
jgi:hypothetical protein